MNQLSIGVFFLRKWGLKCGSTNEATTKRWNLEGAGQDYGGAFIGIASIFSTKCWEGFIRAFGSKAIYIYIYIFFFLFLFLFFGHFTLRRKKCLHLRISTVSQKAQKTALVLSSCPNPSFSRNSSPLAFFWGPESQPLQNVRASKLSVHNYIYIYIYLSALLKSGQQFRQALFCPPLRRANPPARKRKSSSTAAEISKDNGRGGKRGS